MSKEKSSPVHFNVNVFVIGVLVACVTSALGFSQRDPAVQWVVPGAVLVAAIAGALFWPQKKRARSSAGS